MPRSPPAFIPVFSRVVLDDGDDDDAWRLASSVLNLISLATFVLAALAFALAPLIVPLLAPGLGAETGRADELHALAVELTRVMLISPLMFGVSGMLTGILNARQHFLAPSIAPLLYNLGIILGAVLLADRWGVHGLAWGVVIGSVGHLVVQVPALYAVGMRWRPSLGFASAGVREVLRLMGPRVLGLAAAQVNLVVVMFFASFVSDEAISAVNFAFLVMLLPVGVIGMAISTAAFPTFANLGAEDDIEGLGRAIDGALRMILFLAIPASAGLVLLADPTVRLLLQRGAFDADSTALVVSVLVVYAVAVWAHASVEIMSRGFYALSDTRTPVAIAVFGMLLNVAGCAALVEPFGIAGLAAAASIAAVAEFALLLWALRRRLAGRGVHTLGAATLGRSPAPHRAGDGGDDSGGGAAPHRPRRSGRPRWRPPRRARAGRGGRRGWGGGVRWRVGGGAQRRVAGGGGVAQRGGGEGVAHVTNAPDRSGYTVSVYVARNRPIGIVTRDEGTHNDRGPENRRGVRSRSRRRHCGTGRARTGIRQR